MPSKLEITDVSRAKRHVLGQQMYRLRRMYRMLMGVGVFNRANDIRVHIDALSREYDCLGGRPKHRGNVL